MYKQKKALPEKEINALLVDLVAGFTELIK